MKRIRPVLLATAALTLSLSAWCPRVLAQPVAGSIEGGLQDLARAIVEKSSQNDADVIAVLPFPNSDGSCSVLGTYLADELIQSLFSVSAAKLRIIERSQLEALLRENKIGEVGLLNPATTQKIGSLSGVKALVIGTVTVIGDHIRINARVVSTVNGQTVSAATIGIARNGEIDGLLQQSISGSGGICGATAIAPGDSGGEASGGPAPAEASGISVAPSRTYEGVTFGVQSVSRSSDKKTLSVVVALTDRTKTSIQAVLVHPAPSVIDDQAGLGKVDQTNGIEVCGNVNGPFQDGDWCSKGFPRTRWTTLSPGEPTMLLLRFTGEQALQGNRVSVAASLLLTPITQDPKQAPPPRLVSISLANLPIGSVKSTP